MPKPLSGRTVVVTRPRAQARTLERAVRKLGGRPVLAPVIRIANPSSWRPLDRALQDLDAFDVLVFTSANGVDRFFARAKRASRKPFRLPKRVFAIGPATAQALHGRGVRGVAVPDRFEGEALARHLLSTLGRVRGLRILIPRARVARDVLPKILARAGAQVRVVEAYRTMPDAEGRRRLRRQLAGSSSPIVTFTSPSTVEQCVAAIGRRRARQVFRRAAAASIGPVTSRALRAAGIEPAVEARAYTVDGLARALAGLGAGR